MVCVIVGGESEGVSILGPPSSTDAPLGHILIICCEVQVSVMLTLPPPPRCAFVDGSHQGYQRSSCRDSSSNQLKVIHCTPCEHVHQKKRCLFKCSLPIPGSLSASLHQPEEVEHEHNKGNGALALQREPLFTPSRQISHFSV